MNCLSVFDNFVGLALKGFRGYGCGGLSEYTKICDENVAVAT